MREQVAGEQPPFAVGRGGEARLRMQQQLRAPVFEDKVVDHLVGLAKVTEKEISKEKLQKAVEALDEM